MRRWGIIFLLCMLAASAYAAHDFTINGEEEVWVSLGDTLHLQFSYEDVGNAADIAVTLSAMSIEVPLYETTDAPLADGIVPDETDFDGVFSMHIPANFTLPEAAAVIITVTDDGVSDTATLHFEALDSTFYIHGTVMQEGSWIDLPVPAALVYTFYNASIEEIQGMLQEFDIEAFLTWMTQDHYVLSEMTAILGNYELHVPDTIPNVNCTVGVYSMLDYAGDFVGPDVQSVTVNGATEVNFFYAEPDGHLEGEVTNTQGDLLPGTLLTLTQPGNPNFWRVLTADSLAQFSVPLANGDYSLAALASGYEPWQTDVTIAGDDVWVDVEMEIDSPAWVHLATTVHYDNNDPVVGAVLGMTWQQFPDITYTATSNTSGELELDVPVGDYYAVLVHNDEEVWNTTITVDETTVLAPIVIPYTAVDEDALTLQASSVVPNPFNPSTTVRFTLAHPAQASVCVFDVRGRKVRSLYSGALAAGPHSVVWDGRDGNGETVGSGVYLLRVQAGRQTTLHKALLLK